MNTLTSHLDYYVKSFEAAKEPEEVICQFGGWRVQKELGKVRQYERGFLLYCGGYLLLSRDEKQGSLLELGGKALASLRKEGESDLEILMSGAVSDLGRKTTRIDYCWNIPGRENNPQQTLKEWGKKRKTTLIRSKPTIYAQYDDEKRDIAETGMSIYYGSKDSDNRIIVYDKAAEMGVLAEALTRVELRVRHEYASLLVQDMLKHDPLPAAQQKLKSTLDFPKLKWWQKLYTGDIIELSPKRAASPNAIGYLQNTIDAFVRNNIQDQEFREELLAMMSVWAQISLDIENK